MLVRYIKGTQYESGFAVCKYKTVETNEVITGIGTNLPTFSNVIIDIDAEEINHVKYGRQYRISSYRVIVDVSDKDSIINYLSCKYISGINKKLAEAIYDKFGALSLDILENHTDRLKEVKGIKDKTLDKIKTSYVSRKAEIELSKYILPFGLPIEVCTRIYKKYAENSLEIIKTQPYRLCDEIRGITFKNADLIAKNNNIKEDCVERIRAAAHAVLRYDMCSGSVCMDITRFKKALIRELNTSLINDNNICEKITSLIVEKSIRYTKHGPHQYIYLPAAFEAERDIAKRIETLLQKNKKKIKGLDALIDKFSDGIAVDDTQKEAIRMGVTEPIFVITGGPGTGKTTIIKIIAQINQYLDKRNNIVLLSPTGRAARRITESTGYNAFTIHSALGINVIDENENDEDMKSSDCIEDASILVDEASMVDMWLMDALLKSICNCTIGFIGDADQLPSVKCGSILRDLIACGRIPCVQLKYIHRQTDEAANICNNAYNIKLGNKTLSTGDDFNIIEALGLEDAEQKIIPVALENIDKYRIYNTKVLCPIKKDTCGVYSINNSLQHIKNINKEDSPILTLPNGMTLKKYDPVIQLKNTGYISNGDIGYVTDITEEDVTVAFITSSLMFITYSIKDAKEQLLLAYATTVHKSQGSEYDSVIVPLLNDYKNMRKRNLLYTAITRGKSNVTLIGEYSAFYKAIEDNMTEDRLSLLKFLLNSKASEKEKESVSFRPVIADNMTYEQLTLKFD